MADFEQALEDLDVDAFWREGYAILPDVYTEEEVAQMREEDNQKLAILVEELRDELSCR